MIGLQEPEAASWMRNSGVPWNSRYRYLVKGWWNNWGYSTPDGAWARRYMDSCPPGMIPTFAYYCVRSTAPVGEANFYQKCTSATTMRQYFTEFRDLMRRAKDYGKPVLVLMEADGFAYLARQTNDNPAAVAAVASTGMPELAGLPNTVTGWMRAFDRLRDQVGATNVVLGIHVSTWATGVDLMHGSGLTADLKTHVDRAHAFLSGALDAYDLLVGDPCDRDADFYRITQGSDRWYTPALFDRYAEWLRLWNEKAAKRWILWQVPCGNANSANVENNGQPRGGYRDNRSEQFLGSPGRRRQYTDAGVIGFLFGAGATGQATHMTDHDVSGQLYIRRAAKAIFDAGGVPLVRDPDVAVPPLLEINATLGAVGPQVGSTVTVRVAVKNLGGDLPSGSLVLLVGEWSRTEPISVLAGGSAALEFTVPIAPGDFAAAARVTGPNGFTADRAIGTLQVRMDARIV